MTLHFHTRTLTPDAFAKAFQKQSEQAALKKMRSTVCNDLFAHIDLLRANERDSQRKKRENRRKRMQEETWRGRENQIHSAETAEILLKLNYMAFETSRKRYTDARINVKLQNLKLHERSYRENMTTSKICEISPICSERLELHFARQFINCDHRHFISAERLNKKVILTV
jgi:hypothetical protein